MCLRAPRHITTLHTHPHSVVSICCSAATVPPDSHGLAPRPSAPARRPPAADLQAGATPSYIFGCARQPGGTLVAAACCDGGLRFWSLRPTGHLEWAGQVGQAGHVTTGHGMAGQLRFLLRKLVSSHKAVVSSSCCRFCCLSRSAALCCRWRCRGLPCARRVHLRRTARGWAWRRGRGGWWSWWVCQGARALQLGKYRYT